MKVFPEKLVKKLPEGFVEAAQGMDTEEIKKKIVECRGNIFNIENDMEENEKIVAAKEELKEMIAPYRESKAAENAKIVFLIFTMQERGVQVGVGDREEGEAA